jgi:protein regulator of cytokinesis 1
LNFPDSVSEELLATHEAEAQRLAEELESKGPLLQKAQEWVDLKNKEEELEAKRNGPDRFNTRGGALLQEEKMRKRIGILKPKVCTIESPLKEDRCLITSCIAAGSRAIGSGT